MRKPRQASSHSTEGKQAARGYQASEATGVGERDLVRLRVLLEVDVGEHVVDFVGPEEHAGTAKRAVGENSVRGGSHLVFILCTFLSLPTKKHREDSRRKNAYI